MLWVHLIINFVVAECQPGTWGDMCRERCHCQDSHEVCNHINGSCTSGCGSGYGGLHCNLGRRLLCGFYCRGFYPVGSLCKSFIDHSAVVGTYHCKKYYVSGHGKEFFPKLLLANSSSWKCILIVQTLHFSVAQCYVYPTNYLKGVSLRSCSKNSMSKNYPAIPSYKEHGLWRIKFKFLWGIYSLLENNNCLHTFGRTSWTSQYCGIIIRITEYVERVLLL